MNRGNCIFNIITEVGININRKIIYGNVEIKETAINYYFAVIVNIKVGFSWNYLFAVFRKITNICNIRTKNSVQLYSFLKAR